MFKSKSIMRKEKKILSFIILQCLSLVLYNPGFFRILMVLCMLLHALMIYKKEMTQILYNNNNDNNNNCCNYVIQHLYNKHIGNLN